MKINIYAHYICKEKLAFYCFVFGIKQLPLCMFFLQKATPDMHQFLNELRQRVRVGVVGGSDLDKIKEQLGDDGVYNNI